MADTSLQKFVARLAGRISDEEIDAKIAEIDAQMSELGRARGALQAYKTAQELAAAVVGKKRTERPSPDNLNRIVGAVNENGRKPSLRDALRAIFRDARGVPLTIDQVMELLEARDWTPAGDNPRKLVGSALSGLVHRNGELRVADRGTYQVVVGGPLDPLPFEEANGSQETASNRLFLGSASGEAGGEGT